MSSSKIIKYEYLTSEEILPSNQTQIIEHTKFTYSCLGKAFQKQTKTVEDQGKILINSTKESGKQIIESNKVAKNDFNIDRSRVLHEKQKEIFDKLVNERAFQFADIKYKTDPTKFVYQFGDQLLMYELLGTTEKRITKEKKW